MLRGEEYGGAGYALMQFARCEVHTRWWRLSAVRCVICSRAARRGLLWRSSANVSGVARGGMWVARRRRHHGLCEFDVASYDAAAQRI